MLIITIATLAGAFLPFAFSPFAVYTLAFISPAILFAIWLISTPKQAFIRGFLFGLGCFGVGTSWIFISINTYGQIPFLLSIVITVLFVITLALFPATQGYLLNRLFKNKSDIIKCLCLFPASWVLWEWLRSILFTGFPWLFLGYSQINSPLRGFAPLFCVYGISLTVALISGSLVLLGRRNTYLVKITCVVIIGVLIGAGALLSSHPWTQPAGKPIQVSLVQGNIKQSLKWQPGELQHSLKIYKTLTEKNWGSKLIVWPEASVPTFPQQIKFFFNNMDKNAKLHKDYLIIGAPIMNDKTKEYFNGMMLIGAGKGLYLKRHLVPFGEYLPLKFLFSGLIKTLKIPMSDFTAGSQQQPPFKIGTIPIAPFICYEIAYPMEVLNSVKGKQMIIVITDDSWFGQSIALNQQLEMAQMRALETGRYVLHSANTGITAFINPQGKIKAMLPENKEAVLTATATPMKGNTPLMRWNYYPVLGLVIMLLLLGLLL